MHHVHVIKDGNVNKVVDEILVDGVQYVDAEPREGSNSPVTSGGVFKVVGNVSEGLDKTETDLANLAELFFLNTKNIEVPSKKAQVGYALYADSDGNKHFICDKSLDAASIPAGWEFVGPVALREGDKATILYKTETSTLKWANCWIFIVEGLKLDGTDTMVLQQGPVSGTAPVEIGTFTASAEAVDLDTLVAELDEWLRENTTAEGAASNYNWHAEKLKDVEGNDACFIVVDNMSSQTWFTPVKSSTTGAYSFGYLWDFGGFSSNESSIVRKDGVSTSQVIWNKERFKQYNTSIGSVSDSLESKGIYNEAGFNATTVLKGFYGTYDNYLDHMTPDENATTGTYGVFKGRGKEFAGKVADMVVKDISGTDKTLYPAESAVASLKAHSTASVEGLNAGDFYIPSIDQSYKILSAMKLDGSDAVNAVLSKAGVSPIALNTSRWIPARLDTTSAYKNNSNGDFATNGMIGLIRSIAVAEIDL